MEIKGGCGMLVQFRVKNYTSFREEACLDMRAIKAYKEHPYNLCPLDNGEHLLKVAAIYGANASGKSNFIRAYYDFSRIVAESFNNADNKISVLEKYYHPFLFVTDAQNTDTEFSAAFIDDEYQYEYGFVYNAKEIISEWLYRKGMHGARKSMIFERDRHAIRFGPRVDQNCKKYMNDIEKDVLVLSFFNRLKLQTTAFRFAYDTIVNCLTFLTFSQRVVSDMIEYFFKDIREEIKFELLSFFRTVGIQISDFTVEKSDEGNRVRFIHPGVDGKTYSLPIERESEGTRKVVILYLFARMAIRASSTLLVDELNMQLHPLLVRYIVNMFHASESRGQLIYTTHDTTLLDRSFFRRDEVWFVEKSPTCESTLYSLADFSIRKDASFEKEYLGGAYGGIPILQSCNQDECGV